MRLGTKKCFQFFPTFLMKNILLEEMIKTGEGTTKVQLLITEYSRNSPAEIGYKNLILI